MARNTRSRAAREAAILIAEVQHLLPQVPQGVDNSLQRPRRVSRNTLPEQRPPITSEINRRPARKKQKTKDTLKSSSLNELPHNLGPRSPVSFENKSFRKKAPVIKKEEMNNILADKLQITVDKATETVKNPNSGQKKKTKKTNTYGLIPGVSPFPHWTHPTPEECEEVNKLLSSIHGEIVPPTTIPEPSLTVTGCGEVPSVLDALIRTLLSGATTGRNSAMAFNGLVERFGILEQGIGKGSVNWDAVRRATVKDVFEAIKRGGLADVKSKNLKAILDMVYEENQQRRDAIVKSDENGPPDLKSKPKSEKEYEIACADQGFLSLNYLHSLSTEQAMVELIKYPGIGPKTAACVLLFCLQRPCFAVDTHIFRITKWLNWVPPDKATEITTFGHLEVRIPDHLKYPLHQLFIRHGKSCPRCRAITGQSSAGWEDGCVIDHLVVRTGKKKGELETSSKKSSKVKPKRQRHHSSSSESSESSLSSFDETE